MPTHDARGRFLAAFERPTPSKKRAFLAMVAKFVADIGAGAFRKGLRLNRVRSRAGVWEMTRADDGWATFEHGESVRPGDPHVVWRRVGSHDVPDNP